MMIFFREKINHLPAPVIPFFAFLFLLIIFSNGYAAAPGIVQATPAMTSAVDAGGNIQADGTNIAFPGQSIPEPVPYVVDWDNDGKKDLLIGTDDWQVTSPDIGRLRFYKNIGTDADPVLTYMGHVRVNASCGYSNDELQVDTAGG